MSPARKRGPKPKPKRVRLTERLTIRLRAEDRRAIDRAAGDQDASEWARELLLAEVRRRQAMAIQKAAGEAVAAELNATLGSEQP